MIPINLLLDLESRRTLLKYCDTGRTEIAKLNPVGPGGLKFSRGAKGSRIISCVPLGGTGPQGVKATGSIKGNLQYPIYSPSRASPKAAHYLLCACAAVCQPHAYSMLSHARRLHWVHVSS